MGEVEEETQYFSKDFDWEDLKEEIEKDSSLHHHFLSFEPISTSSSSPSNDSDAWKSFHNSHSTGKFFKERRYLLKEFPELLHCDEDSKVLEVGCGNGSTVLPILRDSIVVYACDCSTEALDRAKETIDTANGVSTKHRLHTFCCDLSLNGLPDWLICNTCRRSFLKRPFDCKTDVKENKEALLDGSSSFKQASCCVGGVNFVTMVRDEFIETRLPDPQRYPHRRVSVLHPTDWLFWSLGVEDELCSQLCALYSHISKDVDSEPRQSVLAPLIYQIFTLSAVQYKGMPPAIAECFDVLKPGGLLLFRDYGLYDMTMLRFQPNQRVGFREYMRFDGTRSYFFCLDTVRNLFVGAGFIELELEYCCVKSVNRRNRKIMRRVWVHGKFQKPI